MQRNDWLETTIFKQSNALGLLQTQSNDLRDLCQRQAQEIQFLIHDRTGMPPTDYLPLQRQPLHRLPLHHQLPIPPVTEISVVETAVGIPLAEVILNASPMDLNLAEILPTWPASSDPASNEFADASLPASSEESQLLSDEWDLNHLMNSVDSDEAVTEKLGVHPNEIGNGKHELDHLDGVLEQYTDTKRARKGTLGPDLIPTETAGFDCYELLNAADFDELFSSMTPVLDSWSSADGAGADANSGTLNSSGTGNSCGLADSAYSLKGIVVTDTYSMELPYGHYNDAAFAEAYAFFVFCVHVGCLGLMLAAVSHWLYTALQTSTDVSSLATEWHAALYAGMLQMSICACSIGAMFVIRHRTKDGSDRRYCVATATTVPMFIVMGTVPQVYRAIELVRATDMRHFAHIGSEAVTRASGSTSIFVGRLITGYMGGTMALPMPRRIANMISQQFLLALPPLLVSLAIGDHKWLKSVFVGIMLPTALGFGIALIQEWGVAELWVARRKKKRDFLIENHTA